MKTYPFSALLGRMKYITRWSLMRSARPESLTVPVLSRFAKRSCNLPAAVLYLRRN